MSGHFVVRLTSMEIEDIQNAWLLDNLTVPVLGAIQHQAVGWNQASRQELNTALNQGVQNRNGLPPHKYLDFGVGDIGNKGVAYLIQNRADQGWIAKLKRPNMGLKALSTDAQAEWDLGGRERESFITQIRNNGATLEIYYLDNNEIA